jgi:hypothetical protein
MLWLSTSLFVCEQHSTAGRWEKRSHIRSGHFYIISILHITTSHAICKSSNKPRITLLLDLLRHKEKDIYDTTLYSHRIAGTHSNQSS